MAADPTLRPWSCGPRHPPTPRRSSGSGCAAGRSATATSIPPAELDALELDWSRWTQRIERPPPGWATFVAEARGRTLGFASLGPSRDEHGVGELYAIYVDPDEWSRGAGRALIARGGGRASPRSTREATLWVLEDNPRARRFYEAAGWRADGARQRIERLGVSPAEVRYRKRLAPPGCRTPRVLAGRVIWSLQCSFRLSFSDSCGKACCFFVTLRRIAPANSRPYYRNAIGTDTFFRAVAVRSGTANGKGSARESSFVVSCGRPPRATSAVVDDGREKSGRPMRRTVALAGLPVALLSMFAASAHAQMPTGCKVFSKRSHATLAEPSSRPCSRCTCASRRRASKQGNSPSQARRVDRPPGSPSSSTRPATRATTTPAGPESRSRGTSRRAGRRHSFRQCFPFASTGARSYPKCIGEVNAHIDALDDRQRRPRHR